MIQYKSVPGPVGITISKNDDYASAVKQYAAIIDREAVGGWKFECIRKLPVTKKAGCIASLFGHEDITLYVNMIVFSKDDSTGIASGGIPRQTDVTNEIPGHDRDTGEIPGSNYGGFVNSVTHEVGYGFKGEAGTPERKEKSPDKNKLYIAVAATVAVILGIVLIKSISDSKPDTRYDRNEPDYDYDEYDESADTTDDGEFGIYDVIASSWLEEPDYEIKHYPLLVTEERTDTAWVEDAPGNGIGEWIALKLDTEYTISGFKIMAGYWKSEELYTKNSRPKELIISFPDGTEYEAQLEDVMQYQIFTFDYTQEASEIKFTIKDVYPGDKYEDTVITYIELF